MLFSSFQEVIVNNDERKTLKFLKMAFDSNPFYLAACVNVTALCKVAVQSTLWCENER